MRFKSFLLVSTLSGVLVLSACGKADDNKTVVIDEETGEEIVVDKDDVENQEKEKALYSEHLSNTFTTSISLQDTFAHSLDDLFKKDLSANQFAKILKEDIIDQSREAVDNAEKYNFPTDFYEMNKMVVTNLNNQHQLFLDAVNEATMIAESDGEKLDIVTLRSRLAELKQEYLSIVNTWKNGGTVDDSLL